MDGYIDGPGRRLDTQAGLAPVSSLSVVSVRCLLVHLSVRIIFFFFLDMLDRSGSGVSNVLSLPVQPFESESES